MAGKGYAILRRAGIAVVERCWPTRRADALAGYLIRSLEETAGSDSQARAFRDGMIGRQGAGQVPITGGRRAAQVQLMRARPDAILVGIGTALADDPC